MKSRFSSAQNSSGSGDSQHIIIIILIIMIIISVKDVRLVFTLKSLRNVTVIVCFRAGRHNTMSLMHQTLHPLTPLTQCFKSDSTNSHKVRNTIVKSSHNIFVESI